MIPTTTNEILASQIASQKMTVEEVAQDFRKRLLGLEQYAKNYIQDLKDTKCEGETIAQATLAMRHIEDARMRYGKVLQYLGDGVSIYNK